MFAKKRVIHETNWKPISTLEKSIVVHEIAKSFSHDSS